MYLPIAEYKGNIPQDEIEQRLSDAKMAIDGLTYNRIVRKGFDNLTPFQQRIIKRAVQKQAEFCYDNAEILDSLLSSYGISGVSMSFDKDKIVTIGSVTTSREVYGLLMQTGLCYGGVG